MSGEELKNLVLKSGQTKRYWADIAKIGEKTFGNLYNKTVVRQIYINKLITAGLVKEEVGKKEETGEAIATEKKKHTVSAHPAIECLQHKIEGLHQVIKLLTDEQAKMRNELRELQDFKRDLLMKQYNR